MNDDKLPPPEPDANMTIERGGFGPWDWLIPIGFAFIYIIYFLFIL